MEQMQHAQPCAQQGESWSMMTSAEAGGSVSVAVPSSIEIASVCTTNTLSDFEVRASFAGQKILGYKALHQHALCRDLPLCLFATAAQIGARSWCGR